MNLLIQIKNINIMIFVFSLCAILYALSLQYFFGMIPCKLCNLQRYPYYIIILAYLLNFILNKNNNIILIIIFISLLFEFGFSSYHSLVSLNMIEYSGCSSSIELPSSTEGLKKALKNNNLIIDCGEANKKMFGIHLSSYNAFISIFFMLMISVNVIKKK